MKTSIKILSAILSITLLIIVLNGCKKTDQPAKKMEQNNKIPDWVIKKAIEGGYSSTILINKKSAAMFLDGNENEIGTDYFAGMRTTTVPCDAADDDFLDNTFTLTSETTKFVCTQGYSVTVKYRVSTAFNIVMANPNNSSQLTRGRFRIKKTSDNSVLYTNSSVTINSSDIVLIGADPTYPDKNIYEITYTTPTINDPNLELQNVYFEHRPIVYSDCADVIITPAAWEATPYRYLIEPCDKIDLIQILPNGSASIVYFNGCDAGVQFGPSCYPDPIARPQEHEIQWKKVGDATYGNYGSPIPFNNPYGCSPSQTANLPSILTWSYRFLDVNQNEIKGNITFRYRNVKRSSDNGCTSTQVCTGPWSNDVVVNVQ